MASVIVVGFAASNAGTVEWKVQGSEENWEED